MIYFRLFCESHDLVCETISVQHITHNFNGWLTEPLQLFVQLHHFMVFWFKAKVQAKVAGLPCTPVQGSPEQLILEAALRDGEVDQGDLDAHLRQVVRVAQLGGHVQTERLVVVHLRVSQFDQQPPSLSEYGTI